MMVRLVDESSGKSLGRLVDDLLLLRDFSSKRPSVEDGVCVRLLNTKIAEGVHAHEALKTKSLTSGLTLWRSSILGTACCE